MPSDGLIPRAIKALQEARGGELLPGQTVVNTNDLDTLREAAIELSATRRDMDLLGWGVMDYFSGRPQELRAETRRKWSQKARYAWMNDPMAGAAVDLMNDFVFGRGLSKPRAKDEEVQNVIDEFWDDPDNQLVLTTYAAQVELGTDLTLQSNVFLLLFEGDDGKVKLGYLNHDDVEDAVRDPDNRLRVLYYVAKQRRIEWDYEHDRPKIDLTGIESNKPKVYYYEHWQNVKAADEEGRALDKPPAEKMGDGLVYHIAINKGKEQVFGTPTMQRVLRWFGAYNDLMKSQVDMAKARAAFVGQVKVKGTENQLTKMASRMVTRQSDLGQELAGAYEATGTGLNPPIGPGAMAGVNENASIEPLKFTSGSAEAAQDAQMLRAQVSAGIHFPQHYLGDAGSANLATATAMELPVLKAVESRQEVFKGAVMWAVDRAIEHAVDTGRLDPNVVSETEPDATAEQPQDANEAVPPQLSLVAAHEDKTMDEASTERDLGYEFSMPPPLKRSMPELVTAVTGAAQTFDPNNTNVELSRILLGLVLSEAFEMPDPQDLVERIFPADYVDPAIAAAQAAAGFGSQGGGGFGAPPEDAQSDGSSMMGGDTTYGAKGGAVPAEKQRLRQARAEVFASGRAPHTMLHVIREERYEDLPETARLGAEARKIESDRLYDREVGGVVSRELARLVTEPHANGGGE